MEMTSMKLHAHPMLWLVLLMCAGCGEPATGIAVSGTVTRAGKPVEAASILFVPKKGTKGQPVRAEITGGKYRVAAQEGLQAGHYLIEVSLTGMPPDKESIMTGGGIPKPVQTFKREREITGQNAQIDLEL
jgi:hypothetical protein